MPRVLIADDEEFVRDYIRAVLETNSFEVVGEVESGDVLPDVISDVKPDILLLDINMPKLTGIEFLKRYADKFPELCIIILTSSALATLIGEAELAGAKCFLRKDTEIEEMINAINTTWSIFRKEYLQ